MPNLETLYARLPVFLQNAAFTLRGVHQRRLRFGGDFPDLYEWLEQSQWWSRDQIRAYQDAQLRKLVEHAYTNTAYYHRVFDAYDVRPSDIQSRDDLPKLPLLTKENVRLHLHEMVSNAFKEGDLVHGHTSGSTGTSLQLMHEPRAIQFRWAIWSRHKRRFGIRYNDPYATFAGRVAVPLAQQHPPFWRENRAMRQTYFPMQHITSETVDAIVARLNRGGFAYYTGYPSILRVLADLILERGLKITAPPKVIFTGAETLYEDQRALIAEVFQCPVTDQYGFSEGCGNASRCQQDVFHEDFEYCILECVDEEPFDAKTKRGRIIATGFSSLAVPFIRYEVGDIGVWSAEQCTCGRSSHVLLKVEGRTEDFVLTPEGRRILRFDHLFKDTYNVKEAQVIQHMSSRVTIRIVRRPEYSQADEAFIAQEIARTVSAKLGIDFEYVDHIEREPNGKYRAVKSYINT